MKKIAFILILTISVISAQPFNINYSVVIENCENTDYFEIMTGTMNEGESFEFQAVTLPSEYSSAQYLYNVFVGSEFGIPEGALTENIDIKISMGNFWCKFGILESPEGVFRLFSLFVEITGENSGYNPESYYWFEQNKEAFIKIDINKIEFFLTLLKINDPNEIQVFFVNENEIDLGAIRKEITDNNFIIYPKHFSLLSAGIVSETTDVLDEISSIGAKYSLKQNYPNPFNPETTISYTLSSQGLTKLSIFNIIGEEVKSLVNENQSAGSYRIKFSADDLPSGLYFYTLNSGNFTKTNKMILMK